MGGGLVRMTENRERFSESVRVGGGFGESYL